MLRILTKECNYLNVSVDKANHEIDDVYGFNDVLENKKKVHKLIIREKNEEN